MKKQRFKAVAMAIVLSAGALVGGAAQADQTIDSIIKVGQDKTVAARRSQQRIDKLQDDTNSLFQEFKTVNKQIEGLRVYNAQLEKQIKRQLEIMAEMDASIEQVTVMERQIQPLIFRMLDGLRQFVELDAPFLTDERQNRLTMLENNMERADISAAEKFRQVLEAYKIEAEYGRKISTYKDSLVIEGQEREVNILRIGRIALMYQTTDTQLSGAWNKESKTWEALPGDYRTSILKGIKIAKKQATQDVLTLPILSPEVAK